MTNFFERVCRWLELPVPTAQVAPRVRVLRQYRAATTAPTIVVQRLPRPYWDERGWRQEGGAYHGYYQTKTGSWPGYITVSPGGRVEVYIHNPPNALERHPHWTCFQRREGGWYFIHPTTPVSDVSAAVLSVEKTISESEQL